MHLTAEHAKCSGCRTCLLACALENFREINPARAALAIAGHFPAPGTFSIRVCDQCGACAEVCPVEAIYLQEGVYLIDAQECTGCLTCVDVCPNEVLFAPINGDDCPVKCTSCGVCVSICPRDALHMEGD